MNCCYIIYSKKANHYYVGASRDLLERIRKHNEKAYGSKAYTAIADDWQLFHFIDCDNYAHALRIERHVKEMKSRTYIENLKKYPEMCEKLKIRFR